MLYKDILDINKNFQYSVNIEYDLMHPNKIKEYIPTSDVCDVLKTYIKSIVGNNRNEKRATLLIGPYGKGKSFLILTLLKIVCFDHNKSTKILLDRIKKIDIELYNLISNIKKNKIKLLPVIIDSNYYNIEQSFLMAIKKSLELFEIKDVVPDTVYDVCLKVIADWELDKKKYKEIVQKCSKLNKINIVDLKLKLKNFDREGYYLFERLYNCVVNGIPFNPMINTDIVKMYEDINRKIRENGFSGIFIVYDEFSKTLESNNPYLSHDLKLIQDFAELSNRSSKDEQIHLCCITHKTMESYRTKESNISDDFRKIAGRFKEIRFNRNLNQNYQILSFTLNKKEKYENVKNKFINDNELFYKELKDSRFIDDKEWDLVINETFPLNPITEYMLIQLSEMIAQNERTMFTLISDNDEHSFNHFINNYGKGLYNADNLYNYFSNAFGSEDNEIKNIYYRCESALSRTEDDSKKRILKVLAIIMIIHDFSKISPTSTSISLALNMNPDNTRKIIESLINEDRLLKITKSNSYVDFAYNSSKEIDNELEKFISLKSKSIIISDILNKYNDDSFVIPRKYNTLKQINRFFKVLYLEADTYMNLNSFNILFDKWYCDGLVIRIIKNKYSYTKIEEHYHELDNHTNVVVIVSKDKMVDIVDDVNRICALENLIKKEDNPNEIKQEASMMLYELVVDINLTISKSFMNIKPIISEISGKNINDTVSNICNIFYEKMPIINNDMINKKNVSTQYIKFRNEIVKRILEKKTDFSDLSPTSPEMTIYNSFYKNNELSKDSKELVNTIKSILYKKESKRINFSKIVNTLQSSPYGLKAGVLPVYIALAISSITDAAIFYYEDSEIDVNPANIEKICNYPDKYYVMLEKGSKDIDTYIGNLLSLFNINERESYYVNIKNCYASLRDWANNLPIIVKECNKNDNFLNLNDDLLEIKSLLLKYDVNPRQLVIEDMPSIFNNDLKKTIRRIKGILDVDSYLTNYINELAKKMVARFIPEYKGHLLSCVREWEDENNINYSNVIFEGPGKVLNELFTKTYQEDMSLVNQISTAVIGYRVVDWTGNNEDRLLKAIDQYVSDSLNKKSSISNGEISPLGNMFMNNIEAIVDEFSDSISNKEKIFVLNKIIEKYAGGKK